VGLWSRREKKPFRKISREGGTSASEARALKKKDTTNRNGDGIGRDSG